MPHGKTGIPVTNWGANTGTTTNKMVLSATGHSQHITEGDTNVTNAIATDPLPPVRV